MANSRENRNQDTEGQGLARGDKGKKILLADGNEYELSPLTLNMLCELEDKFRDAFEVLQKPSMKAIRFILYLKLKTKYPTITEEKAGELVTEEIFSKLGEIIT